MEGTSEWQWLLNRYDATCIVEEDGPENNEEEKKLCTNLIAHQRHPDFLHVVAVEWWYTKEEHNGKGDIVFASMPFTEVKNKFIDVAHTACKVLVVEVKVINGKGTSHDLKRRKRRKVEEQLNSAMNAWRTQFPKDEVWGCIYSDEQPRWWEKMIRLDPITVHQLTIELLPRGTWSKHYQPYIPLELWKQIALVCKEKTGNRCEGCKATSKLVLHQRWATLCVLEEERNDSTQKIVFLGFQMLCWDCHDVKHAGWAKAEGRLDSMLTKYCTVNKAWSNAELKKHLQLCFQKWGEDSAVDHYEVDDRAFFELDQVKLWKGSEELRFGSLCLKEKSLTIIIH